jgi:hypothetical protein
LFDLIEDPYEKENIYETTDPDIIAVKDMLYDRLDDYTSRARQIVNSFDPSRMALDVWRDTGNCIVPWVKHEDLPYNTVGKLSDSLKSISYVSYFQKTLPKNCFLPVPTEAPIPFPSMSPSTESGVTPTALSPIVVSTPSVNVGSPSAVVNRPGPPNVGNLPPSVGGRVTFPTKDPTA